MNYDSVEDEIIDVLKSEMGNISVIPVPDDLDNYGFTHPIAEIYVGVRSGDFTDISGLNYQETATISVNIKARKRRGENSINDLLKRTLSTLTGNMSLNQAQPKNYELGVDDNSIWNAECYFTIPLLHYLGE